MSGQGPTERSRARPGGPRRWRGALAALACAGLPVAAPGLAAAKPELPELDLSDADRCEFIADPGNRVCLLPFPNDYYTTRDRDTRTGRRVSLHPESMPANAAGAHIDPAPYNLNDGFSPGQPIVVRVPGIDDPEDLRASGAVPINHIGRFDRRRTPIVMIDAKTGKRRPIWAEVDSNASDPDDVALEIHPARNLRSRRRYIIALRNLRTADGEEIPAPAGFRYYRDDVPSDQEPIERRRRHFERLFGTLKRAGIARRGLYLAWDFTVASDRNIADRLLHMRDQSFADLGDRKLADKRVRGRPPAFRITAVDEFTPAENADVAREVRGKVDVPCYLAPDCRPGGRFALGPKGLPTRTGTWEAEFRCVVPRSATAPGAQPVRAAIYGHGLFGSSAEIRSDLIQGFANGYGFVICATDEIGMSSADLPNTAGILVDLSRFSELTDRVQQGLLNELLLGRALIHPGGLGAHLAFHRDGSGATPSVVDTRRLYYEGNSQGGILGGALTAVAPDFTRAVLGVPGMRYSLLLPRATPFDEFAAVLYPNYPDELERPLILSLTQMLWDRSDPNGYARRMTSRPLPDTPKHKVLMAVAFGDHQVTNCRRRRSANDRRPQARPGARSRSVAGRRRAVERPPNQALPVQGLGDLLLRHRADTPGARGSRGDHRDASATARQRPEPRRRGPARRARGIPYALELANRFLARRGRVIDPCGGGPCYAGGYTGQ